MSSLRLGDLEGIDFEIIQESEYSGDDCCLATDDAEEIEAWIVNMIEEREQP